MVLNNKKFKKLFTLIAVFAFLFSPQTAGVLFAAAPTVITGNASSITRTSAELSGSVISNGGEKIIGGGYEYGLTTSYGNTIITDIEYNGGENLITGPFGSGPGESGSVYTDMDIDSFGNIYVIDIGNSRVQKFNSDGIYLSQFGVPGWGDGTLTFAYGMVIDSNDDIYITDNNNGFESRVQKFNSDGVYLSQFGTFGDGPGEFNIPHRIAIDASENIYVGNFGLGSDGFLDANVQKWSSDGAYSSQFGTSGEGDGQFGIPGDMVFDPFGDIYVLDGNLHRVQKFNSDGVYLSQFGTFGMEDDQFYNPSGLGIDSEGNIYVTDSYNYRVKKFTPDGVLLSQFAIPESHNFTDFTFDSEENVYLLGQLDGIEAVVRKFSPTLAPATISPLTCGTTYHFRAFATNVDGTSYGNDETFTTSDCERPNVDTKNATGITQTSATLNGFDLSINDVSIAEVERGFEYGFTTNYGQTVSESGQFISTFDSDISFGGATDSADNLYSSGGSFIRKFNSDGVHLSQFGVYGEGEGEFNLANDVAINSADELYIVDNGGSRIQKWSTDGVYQSQIGTPGSGDGQFLSPYEIAINSADDIYVVDTNNDRVQKFNADGVYQLQFGSEGTADGEFSYPSAIAIDQAGYVYVADYGDGGGRLQKFTSEGAYISTIYTGVIDYLSTGGIQSILFDIDGSIYLTGNHNATNPIVLKLDSAGNILNEFTPDEAGQAFTLVLDSKNNIYAGNVKFNRTFSANLPTLACGKTYHYRAYATNEDGTDYGEDKTFQTNSCFAIATPNKEPHTPVRPPRRPITDKPESRKPETSRPTIVGAEEIKVEKPQDSTFIDAVESKKRKISKEVKEEKVEEVITKE